MPLHLVLVEAAGWGLLYVVENFFFSPYIETCSGGQCERKIMCIYICMYYTHFLVHMYSEQTGQASRDRL